MLIEKPRCNFKNCRYCFDGICFSADKYENCKVTDLHSEIAKLTVDLDNAKAEVAREIFEEIEKEIDLGMSVIQKILNAKGGRSNGKTVLISKYDVFIEAKKHLAKIKKKYTEGEKDVEKNTNL